jgi:integrase
MRGNITRRGKASWRLKFDVGADPVTGKRRIRYQTVTGKRQDAERELARLVTAAHDGTLVEPSKLTLADYLRAWLDGSHGLAPKTAERYRELVERQIIPHLGAVALQKLKPAHVADWHAILLKSGRKDGGPLAPRTVGHAHRVLHRALARAAATERVTRNVASVIRPPTVEYKEVEILDAGQIGEVIGKLAGHPLAPLASLALATGARRGELLALRWSDIDLDGALLRVERSLEETREGLRLKVPKTRHGRRSLSLPPSGVEALRSHRKRQLELRVALGLGKLEPEALVFCKLDGSPLSPDNVSRDWRTATAALGLPRVMFHALRHSHASALIASGLDVVTISRRLGHATPVVTLTVYAHLFHKTDAAAATAIEAAMRTGPER